MGHRKSHNSASRGGTPETLLTHPKDKNDTTECGNKAGGRNRREKRNHKRKREHEDVSKRRHKERHRGSHSSSKERHRGSHGSSKSSSKGKRRDKVHRWKDSRSFESDSSSSFLSSKGDQYGISSHCCDADVYQKRTQRPIADDHKEHRSKRSKLSNDAFSIDDNRENYDAVKEPLRIEKHKLVDSESWKVGRLVSSCKSARPESDKDEETILKGQEQEMGLEGRKDKVLEVELRQKALANFMRHYDASWRTDEHGLTLDSDIRRPATCNEQNEQVATDVGGRYLLAVGNAVNVDAPKDAYQWPRTSAIAALVDEKCLAKDDDNNLEEGEINSDTSIENETENENASFLVNQGKGLHEKGDGNSHVNRDNCDKDHVSRIPSGGEIERENASMAAPCNNEKQEPSQEQAVKSNSNVDLASALQDSNNTFQEKTMSVMRGGEMVQVSYKVYIPKRAAELARRRLQR